MKWDLWHVFWHCYNSQVSFSTKDDGVKDRIPTDPRRDRNSPPAFWGLWVQMAAMRRDMALEMVCLGGDVSPWNLASTCSGHPPQTAKPECPCRAEPCRDIAGAQPTLRSVDSICIFKPTTAVRFHKRQKFAVYIGKLSKNHHLHIASTFSLMKLSEVTELEIAMLEMLRVAQF